MKPPLFSIPGIQRGLLWFVGAAIAGLVVAWWAAGRFADERYAQLVTRQFQQAQSDVGLLGADISQHLARASGLPVLLSQDHYVHKALAAFGPGVQASTLTGAARTEQWASNPDLQAISRQLTEVVERFGLNTVWVTNAAGDTVADGYSPGVASFLGTNYADREYFKAAQAGRLGTQFAVGRVTKVYGLYFSAPVQVQGRFVGMVGASIRLDTLAPLAGDAEFLITDEHGVVVMAQDDSWRLKALPNAQVFQLTPAQRELRYKQKELATLVLQRQGVPGPQALYQWPEHPRPHVFASRPIMNGALQLHVLRELGPALEQLQEDRWRWFALTSLAWLLMLGWLGALTGYLAVSRQQQRELQLLNRELQRQANTDALTGAASRRHYLEALHLEHDRAQRYALPFCVISLDIDHFKHVNDTHGHAAGDAVLRHFALTVQGQLRQSDLLGRVGGEEFSVLLPQTGAEGGLQMAQRIRLAVEASATDWQGQPLVITVSLGGALWLPGCALSVDQLLAASDRALYQAKNEGRNRVVWTQWPGAAASPAADTPLRAVDLAP